MKKESLLNVAMALGVVCVLVAVSSCEWDRANDDATWNDAYNAKYEWVNFSGVYQNTGGWYVVTQFRRPNTDSDGGGTGGGGGGGGSSLPENQYITIGTGTAAIAQFVGNLTDGIPSGKLPVIPGTFSIAASINGYTAAETFRDRDRDGLLYSSQPSSTFIGFINYNTGAYGVQFLFPVSLGASVLATYVSGASSSTNDTGITPPPPPPPRPHPGSTDPIYQFLIVQDGYKITLQDNYGNIYTGRIISISSTAGGVDTDIRPGEAVTIIATFEASGDGVTMSGTLEGTYTAAQTTTTVTPTGTGTGTGTGTTTPTYRGTLENRIIRGIWLEDDGTTGEIEGVAFEPMVVTGP